MVRSITEILKEGEKARELQSLIDLWNEIANKKHKYPLVHLRFANERIRELALKVKGTDIAKELFRSHLMRSKMRLD